MGFELEQAWQEHIAAVQRETAAAIEAKNRKEDEETRLREAKLAASKIVGIVGLNEEESVDQEHAFDAVSKPIPLGELAQPDESGRTHGFAVVGLGYDKTPHPETVIKKHLFGKTDKTKVVWVLDTGDLAKITSVTVRFHAGMADGSLLAEMRGASAAWYESLCDGDMVIPGLLERLEFINDHIAE